MRILFIHQNMPGQFKHLAAFLGASGQHDVRFVTKRGDIDIPGVQRLVYQPARPVAASTHHYMIQMENAVLHGQQVARLAIELDRSGFRPDIVVGHPGWGESLFIKDVWPKTPLLHYCEFFYRARGTDANFDPEDRLSFDQTCRLRIRTAHLLLGLEACDRGLTPTRWQYTTHPEAYHPKLDVIFDGIDTDVVKPDPSATFTLPDGRVLTAADEVVTYVARNLEPYRGFPQFMRALPSLLRLRPQAQIIITGADGVSYGQPAPDGKTWRQTLLEQVNFDPARVHFTGAIPYHNYLKLLQISSAHIYLTVPFVLSWSMVEAMAAGCLMIASATPPVQELIRDNENGWLVDFFDSEALAQRIAEALAAGNSLNELRRQARQTILSGYSVAVCLPRQLALLDRMMQ